MAQPKTPKAPTPQFIISWSILAIPVVSKPAARAETVELDVMHRTCAEAGTTAKLSQKKVCQACNVEVPAEEQVKVHQADDGRLILLTKEQVDVLKPEANKTMTVEAFVALDAVPLVRLGTTNYLGPTEATSAKSYELLRRAMLAKKRVALVSYTSYGKDRIGILRPTDDGLMLHEAFYDQDVRTFQSVVTGPVTVSDEELTLGMELVAVSEVEGFDVSSYSNGFVERVAATIERIIAGEEITTAVAAPTPAPVADLTAALRASLAARKPPVKVEAPKAAPVAAKGKKTKVA